MMTASAQLHLLRQEAIELDRRGFRRAAMVLKGEAIELEGEIERRQKVRTSPVR
jgi:hypothetical protein